MQQNTSDHAKKNLDKFCQKFEINIELPEVEAVKIVLTRAACTKMECKLAASLLEADVTPEYKANKFDRYMLHFNAETDEDAASYICPELYSLRDSLPASASAAALKAQPADDELELP